jgi:predicted site-specific integrase-resolvase
MDGEQKREARLITRAKAAEMLGFEPQTLAKWATVGRHLVVVKVGRSARYRLTDVLRLIEKGSGDERRATYPALGSLA